MDAARAAAMSDPEQNRWFNRRWSERSSRPTEPAPIVNDAPELDGLELLRLWRLERVQTREGSS